MTSEQQHIVRLAAVVLGIGSLGLLTGCSVVQQQIGDAWSVTYEVQVDQPVGAGLTDVRAEGAEGRGGDPEVATLGDEQTDAAVDGGSRWTHEVVVLAEDHASVRATPAAGATATCRILLDGKREIAKETAGPGEPVTCEADTPEFD